MGFSAVTLGIGASAAFGNSEHALGHVRSNPLPILRLWTGEGFGEAAEFYESVLVHFVLPSQVGLGPAQQGHHSMKRGRRNIFL